MKKTLEQELASLRRDIKAIGEQLSSSLGDAYESAEDKAEDYTEEFLDEARSKWERARDLGHRGKRYVEEHPWQSIGAVLAVGFLIGYLTRRRD